MENKLQEIIKFLKSYSNVDIIEKNRDCYELYVTYSDGIKDFLGELSSDCKWKGFDEMDFSKIEIKDIQNYFNDIILCVDDKIMKIKNIFENLNF